MQEVNANPFANQLGSIATVGQSHVESQTDADAIEHDRDLLKLIESLTLAKRENRRADFSEDVDMQYTIDRIHERNPSIFITPTYIIEVDEFSTLLTKLDRTVNGQEMDEGDLMHALPIPFPIEVSSPMNLGAPASQPVSRPFGYNTGSVIIGAHRDVEAYTEAKINALISKLNMLNDQNRDLQRLISAITHAKKDNTRLDFSNDPEMRETINRIHAINPDIFKTPTYIIETDMFDTLLPILDSTVKDQVTKYNETMLYVNQSLQVKHDLAESAQKTLEMLIRHIESIIAKYRKS